MQKNVIQQAMTCSSDRHKISTIYNLKDINEEKNYRLE